MTKPTRPTTQQNDPPAAARKLSRHETHDLGMIIKERCKVLEAHAEDQAKACMADFEKKISAIYKFDEDEVWQAATERAMEEVKLAQDKIGKRCEQLGIPKDLAPRLDMSWNGRGQMGSAKRRDELRRVARSEIEAMKAAAITKIRKTSLDLRTQVVAMGLLTPEATMFLESLAPIEESMRAVDFAEIETKLLQQQASERQAMRRLGYGGLHG